MASTPDKVQVSPSHLIPIILMLSCGFLHVCLVQPSRQELAGLRYNIGQLQTVLSDGPALKDQWTQSAVLLKNRRKELDEVLLLLRTQPQSPLQVLQSLAQNHQVQIGWREGPRQVNSTTIGSPGPLAYKYVTVKLQGRFPRLRDYIAAVCRLEWCLGIERLDLRTRPTQDHSSNLQATLVLKVLQTESGPHEFRADK
jgi:hypothetical protein